VIKYSYYTLFFVCSVFFITSCSLKRNLSDGQSIVKKNKIEIKSAAAKNKNLSDDLKAYIMPPANKSLFNMNVWLYNQHQTKFKKQLQKLNDAPPSYFDEQKTVRSSQKMTSYLQNKGYFGSTVTYSYKTKKHNPKKMLVTYHAVVAKPYTINEIEYKIDNKELEQIAYPYLSNAAFKVGKQYDYYVMSELRDNLVKILKNNGYFMFNPDYIFFEIDSSFQNHTLKVTFNIRPNYMLEDYNQNPLNKLYDKKYFIKDICIQPYAMRIKQDSTLHADTTIVSRPSYENIDDTVDYKIINIHQRKYIRNRNLLPNIYIEPNDQYNEELIRAARTNLSRLSALGSALITFDTIPRIQYADTSSKEWIHGNILIEQGIKQSIAIEVEATTDNVGSFGTSLGVAWSNRNIFRGSELLTLRLKGAMELQKTFGADEQYKAFGIFNTLDGGIQATLSFPRFLAPISSYRFPRFFRPSTDINIGYNYQSRSDYSRNLFLSSFGYRWKPKQQISHTFNIIDVNLVKIHKTAQFDSIILRYHNPRFYEQYSNHFIMATNYTFVYSTQDINAKKNFYYYRITAESCGNLLYAFNSLIKSPKTNDGDNTHFTLFNIRYAQFLKGYFEFRRYQYLNNAHDHLALRFLAGIGIPYGNALSLPFEKSFYGGGTNDLRGFQINSVGPGGSLQSPDTKHERSGDIKIELNAECRFGISGIIKGALFTDIGNVWLLRKDNNFYNSDFHLSRFYKELYWDVGFGIRFDIDIILVRLDLGVPLYNPGEENDKWCIKKTKFSSIVWNFGLGYPF
jgi:outer membrane protein assembly factor BamA